MKFFQLIPPSNSLEGGKTDPSELWFVEIKRMMSRTLTGCLSRRVWLHIYISHCWHATGWQTHKFFSIILFFITELCSKPPHNPGFPKERVNKNFQILTVLRRGGGLLSIRNQILTFLIGWELLGQNIVLIIFFKALLVGIVIWFKL